MTGMFAVCCTLMSLLGVVRRRHPLAKLAHLIPSLMMAAVVVLSQSRTARYSMLGAWAVGCYGVVAGSTAIPKKSLRQLAAVAAGVAVLVGGYMGAAVMTDSAIRHYESVLSGKKEASVLRRLSRKKRSSRKHSRMSRRPQISRSCWDAASAI